MRRLLAVAAAAVLLQTASMAQASDLSFSINVGGPPVVLSQPPEFLYPPELGFGIAVGVPYDLFYFNGLYYIYRGGGWYRSGYWGGDWVRVRTRELPPEFRRYKIGRIHEFRDREYRFYARDRDHYRGRHFNPREEHHEMRPPAREGRPEMREGGHEERRDMREEHRDERGGERERR